MVTLFIRTIIVYLFVFFVIRLMGKRQICDMQPFDLVITLLVADVASVPISDPATPLLYGIVPILALIILHWVVSYAALKSVALRKVVCGSPLVVVAHGFVREEALRSANYSLSDLLEQLRIKDIFSISEVEFAILETNGSLSVLPKEQFQPTTIGQIQANEGGTMPSYMVVMDGKIHRGALDSSGIDERSLLASLKTLGYKSVKDCFFASIDQNGILHVQNKLKKETSGRMDFVRVKNAQGS